MTAPQARLVAEIRAQAIDGKAEYWPVVNDWIKDGAGPELGLRNINRTVAALIRQRVITIDEDGYFSLVQP